MSQFATVMTLMALVLVGSSARAENRFALTLFYGGMFPASIEVRTPTVKKAVGYFETHGYDSLILSNTAGLGRAQAPLDLSTVRSAFDALEGKIKRDDVVVINVITHGDVKGVEHKIVIGQNQLLDVPTLRELIGKLEKKGALIVLLDQSCFSGGSIELGSERTCVVASSSANTVSYRDFSDNLWANVRAGLSVEDVYLATREIDRTITYPAISSPAGRDVDGRLAFLHVGSERGWYRSAPLEGTTRGAKCIDPRSSEFITSPETPDTHNLRALTVDYTSTCSSADFEASRKLFQIFGAERLAYNTMYRNAPANNNTSCRRITF